MVLVNHDCHSLLLLIQEWETETLLYLVNTTLGNWIYNLKYKYLAVVVKFAKVAPRNIDNVVIKSTDCGANLVRILATPLTSCVALDLTSLCLRFLIGQMWLTLIQPDKVVVRIKWEKHVLHLNVTSTRWGLLKYYCDDNYVVIWTKIIFLKKVIPYLPQNVLSVGIHIHPHTQK